MRNIILFIRRFFVLFIFLLLQVLSIAILVKYNRTYEAAFANNANEIIGSIDKQYNKMHEYFTLKKTNEELAKQNRELLNLLKSEYGGADTASFYKVDSLLRDTLKRVARFHFLEARVVNNSVNEENNYITISRGAKQGVKKDMGVLGANGVVGRVILVSDNYSVIMSMLNRNSKISARLKNDTASNSSVDWDGRNPSYVTLHNVSKSAKVKKGDTAVTSNFSTTFPQGLMVGTVYDIATDPSSNFYVLRLKTATNFYNLQYVYLIENTQWTEQHALEAQIPKNER
jgi:rod shape-determining protein MreC